MNTAILSEIADALLCLAYLVGMAAGVIGLTRKQTALGTLATVGFFLLSLAVIVREILALAVLPAILRANGSYMTYGWLDFCIETPLFMLGIILLIVLVFTAINQKAAKSETEKEVPPAP